MKYGEVLDLKTEALPYIQSKEIADKFKASLLRNGDVVIADTAEDETVGKCTEIANLGTFEVLAGLHTIPLRPKQKYAVGYLGYYMNSNSFHDTLLPLMQGTKVTSISKSALQGTTISYPTEYSEQEQIGTYFRNLDKVITLHQRSYNLERESKTTNTWEQRKLGECFAERSERSANGELIAVTINSGVVKASELNRHDNSSEDKSNYKVVKVNDIAYNSMRMWQGASGYSRYDGILSPAYTVLIPKSGVNSRFFAYMFKRYDMIHEFEINSQGLTKDTWNLKYPALSPIRIMMPEHEEQERIADYLENLDNLITLHQCKLKTAISRKYRRYIMLEAITKDSLFHEYYAQWIKVYKEGAIRKVTMDKYLMTHSWLKKLIPNLKICEMTRITYQQLLNDYAECHERQTTMDFHHQLKCAIIDAVDEGMITRDPTRKAIIKGKPPREKKTKYMNQFELHTLLNHLELTSEISWDWFILLVAKTGMRFSEALALTPKDFDFPHQVLSINKTWDYKGSGGFLPTKNKSSVRKIQMDWQTVIQFSGLVRGLPEDEPIFVKSEKCVYNSTVNDILERHCKAVNVPVISVHGLRHTHASLLLFAGVSIASVARRLGHASMTTTQKTYLHIIQELENKDIDLVMRSLSELS